jgi:hypothetical protein
VITIKTMDEHIRAAHRGSGMKVVEGRNYAQPEAAARKLAEIASAIKPAQEGRIFIKLVNWPFLTESRAAHRSCGWPVLRPRAGLVLDARVPNLSAAAQAGGLT